MNSTVEFPTSVVLSGFVFWPVSLTVSYDACPEGLLCDDGGAVSITRDEYDMENNRYQWPTRCEGTITSDQLIEQEITAVDADGKTASMEYSWVCRAP